MITLLCGAFLICAATFVSCSNAAQSTGEDTARESELARVKRILVKEFSILAPMYELEELKYDSVTFEKVTEREGGGHSVSGDIFFTDRHGAVYSQRYRAEIDLESWAPRIVRLDLVKIE